MIKNYNIFKNQSGIVIPIMAVMFMAVFLALVVLGIDARMVSNATAALRAKTNEICSNLIIDAPFHARALDAFVNGVNIYAAGSQNTNTTLLQARVTIPTMSLRFRHSFGFEQADQNDFYTIDDYSLPALAKSPGSAGPDHDICNSGVFDSPPSCSNPVGNFCSSGNFCYFSSDVYHGTLTELPDIVGHTVVPRDVTIAERVPTTLVNNLQNAGNTAICELTASVRTSMSGLKKIYAKSAWNIPAKGVVMDPGKTLGYSFPDNLASPGLSIAIAPHMTTYSFPGSSSAGRPDNKFEYRSPSAIPAIFNSLTNTANAFSAPSAQHQGVSQSGGVLTTSLGAIAAGDARDDLRLACMNPAILTRNLLLSTIIEYISRHGEFRTLTEMMVMGTQHQNARNFAGLLGPNFTHMVANYPTVIVPFRADLAAPVFQLPYVSFFGGVAGAVGGIGDIPAAFGPRVANGTMLAAGFINPLDDYNPPNYSLNAGGSNSQSKQYHALLANQLRMCAHLYSINQISRFNPEFANSNAFAPADSTLPNIFNQPAANNASNLRINYPSGGGTDIWDQACPWSSAEINRSDGNVNNVPIASRTPCNEPGYLLNYQSRLFTAGEIASTLGSVQRCPIQGFDSGIDGQCSRDGFITASGPASDPNIATRDLRPDIIGTLRYIANVRADQLNPYGLSGIPTSNPVISPALESPGYFKLNTTPPFGPTGYETISGLADLRFPSSPTGGGSLTGRYISGDLAVYPAGHPATGPIVLVMHQRLNNLNHAGNADCRPNCNCSNPPPESEACRIQCLINNNFNVSTMDGSKTFNRPITILYFPTTAMDAHPNAIFNILCAFNAVENPSAADPRNGLYVFGPEAGMGTTNFPGFTPTAGCSTAPPFNQPCHYQQFWEFLLTQPPTSPYSINRLARNIIETRLITKRILF